MSKSRFNIDRLKLCLVTNDNINMYEQIQLYENDNLNYTLRKIHKNEKEIIYDVYCNGIEIKLGQLTINNNGESGCISTYHFFEFTNEALYTPFSYQCSLIVLVDYVFDDLGMRVNNITRIELALDTTVNIVTRIDKIIKDENITMIFNNKKIKEMNKKIPDAFYCYGRSRSKRDRVPCLFFKGIHNQVKIYNKMQEIENSGKRYIYEWNNFNSSKMYRLEVRLDRIGWLSVISELNLDSTYNAANWLAYLISDYLPQIWEIALSRVLRFNNKRRQISVLQLL